MTSTTYEWRVNVLYADLSEFNTMPVSSRDFAARQAKLCEQWDDVVSVKLIKRTIVSEEESV